MIRLDNKTIVITGAGSGLGREYALACARSGAQVVVNDVNAEAAEDTVDLIRQQGDTALAFVGSVSSWTDTQDMVEACLAEYGQIDGFVANAAIMHMVEPWDEEESQLRATAEINILGTQFCVRHAMRAMIQGGRGGSIVTVVSGAMHGIAGMSAYGASKGAVAAMTANWALEGQGHGIRVNAVSPWAMTKMVGAHLDKSKADPKSFPTAASIAPLVVSLLADDTADVTGRMIRFDGTRISSYETAVNFIQERAEWTPEAVTDALNGGLRRDTERAG